MLPGTALAEVSAERKQELYEQAKAEAKAKGVVEEDAEFKSKIAVTLISGIVLISPILGITGATKAIEKMVGDDEGLANELRGNDPKIAFQRARERRRR